MSQQGKLQHWARFNEIIGKTPACATARKKSKCRTCQFHKPSFSCRRKWEKEDVQCLWWILDTHQEYFLAKIISKIHVLTGKKFIRATVYLQIQRCGCSCQKCSRWQDRSIRWSGISTSSTSLKSVIRRKCLYFDEMPKGKGDWVRKCTCCRSGTSHQVFRCLGVNDTRYFMLAAADIHSFVVQACSLVLFEARALDTEYSHGTIGKAQFLVWVKECLVSILGNY